MRSQKYLALAIFAAVVFTLSQGTALSQVAKDKFATESAAGSGVRLEMTAPNSGGTITVSAPDGRIFRREFGGGVSPEFAITDNQGARLPDGIYTFELRLAPAGFATAMKDTLKAGRPGDDAPEAERLERKRTEPPAQVQSGSFQILNGQVIVAGSLQEPGRFDKTKDQARPSGALSGNTLKRLSNHRLSLFSSMPDIVQADDVIIQGSLCVGLDCVVNESFGFDTIRLKENNTRIGFNDTSTTGGFPNNSWQLTANDSASGGANKFSIDDITNAKTPFTITGNAPTNSIFVDSVGRVGFHTSTPVLDLHVATGNTPAHRFEQTNTGGFTAQTWDIGANEANFFVRDVTGGSRLPFRIRPGAPTSSIDISASGNVGIGTASPTAQLDVFGTGGNGQIFWGSTGARAALFAGAGSAGIGTFSNHPLVFYTNNSLAQMSLTTTGRLGIGTKTPDQLLSVNGDASKTGGATWQAFSDERLKNIKGRFNPGLKALMQLQPLRYEYKPDNALGLKSGGEHIGFSAQQLQKVIPEAVSKSDSGYLMVNSDPILWTMLNAIKEQQKEIADLKAQVERLQARPQRRKK